MKNYLSAVTEEQLLAEIEDIRRTMPSLDTLHQASEESLAWLGRLSAFVAEWNLHQTMTLNLAVNDLHSGFTHRISSGKKVIRLLLHQASNDLRLKTVGPLTKAVGQGSVFDYFDEMRKIIETARSDLFFIDRYLDAEFVSRYLPHVASGVSIRLLTHNKLSTLLPAVEAFAKQSGAKIQIRSQDTFHDRYVIVDGSNCYQSGASFKDGARTAPTTLTQIKAAFGAVQKTYEDLWSGATIKR